MIVRRAIVALLVGMLFGLGLSVAQMTNPEKVLAFLNLAGGWDPSLLFVMGGAVVVAFFGFRWATNNRPIFDTNHQLPISRAIDLKLVGGAAIFGIGWGIAGYCPGPAIAGLSGVLTGLGSGGVFEPFIFVAAMIVGNQLQAYLQRRSEKQAL